MEIERIPVYEPLVGVIFQCEYRSIMTNQVHNYIMYWVIQSSTDTPC